jgi:hypothetical protein
VEIPLTIPNLGPAGQLLLSLAISLVMAFLKQRFPQVPWPGTPAGPAAPQAQRPLLDAIKKLIDARRPVQEYVEPAPEGAEAVALILRRLDDLDAKIKRQDAPTKGD